LEVVAEIVVVVVSARTNKSIIIFPSHNSGSAGLTGHQLTNSLYFSPTCDAQSFQRGGKGERLRAIYIRDRALNTNRKVELSHSPTLPFLQGVEEIQDGRVSSPFFGIFLFFPKKKTSPCNGNGGEG